MLTVNQVIPEVRKRLLQLDKDSLEEEQLIGIRTLGAEFDDHRIQENIDSNPDRSAEEIARLHINNCLLRDWWYKYEKIYY